MQIAENREDGGKLVRDAWIRKARTQPDPKPSHLVEWQELDEWNKEVDRCIWDEITAPYASVIKEFQQITAQLRKDNERLSNALLDKELAQ